MMPNSAKESWETVEENEGMTRVVPKNRAAKRKQAQRQRRAIGDVRAMASKRQQRLLHKAERDAKRYARMSQERLVAELESSIKRVAQLKAAYDAGALADVVIEDPWEEEAHTPTQEELEDIAQVIADEDLNDPALD